MLCFRSSNSADSTTVAPDDYGAPMTNFHDLHMTSITGDDVDFGGFRDQMALVVNVASK